MQTAGSNSLLEFTHQYAPFGGHSLIVNNLSHENIKLIAGKSEHIIAPGQQFTHVSSEGHCALAFFLLGAAAVAGFWLTRQTAENK